MKKLICAITIFLATSLGANAYTLRESVQETLSKRGVKQSIIDETSKFLLDSRGEMSIIGCFAALCHNVAFGIRYFVEFFTNASKMNVYTKTATIISLILIAMMIPLMITSFKCVRKKMKAKNFTRYILKDINKKFGITIILITHQMEVIRKVCNKATIMSEGKIIEEGETKEIFLNPKSDLAKEFVANIPHDEFRSDEELLKRSKNTETLALKLKLTEDQVNRAFVTEIIKKFDVEINILGGFIDKVSNIIVGNLLIEIMTNKEIGEEILAWLKENKVELEVL